MHALARLIAAAVTAWACAACDAPRKPGPVQRPGIDGLVAFLAPRAAYAPWYGGCFPYQGEAATLAIAGYGEHLTIDAGAMESVWARAGAVHARVLYADDADVPASLRRSRLAFPVGEPPLVASIDGTWIPVLFVFRRRWVCLGTLDARVASAVPEPCAAAYLASASGRCLDFAGALAGAVAADDATARERLCTLLVEHGCGSVPAEAPPPTEPVPTQ